MKENAIEFNPKAVKPPKSPETKANRLGRSPEARGRAHPVAKASDKGPKPAADNSPGTHIKIIEDVNPLLTNRTIESSLQLRSFEEIEADIADFGLKLRKRRPLESRAGLKQSIA